MFGTSEETRLLFTMPVKQAYRKSPWVTQINVDVITVTCSLAEISREPCLDSYSGTYSRVCTVYTAARGVGMTRKIKMRSPAIATVTEVCVIVTMEGWENVSTLCKHDRFFRRS